MGADNDLEAKRVVFVEHSHEMLVSIRFEANLFRAHLCEYANVLNLLRRQFLLKLLEGSFVAPKFKSKSASLLVLKMNDFIESDLLLFVANIEHL
jgi:hypothetical protein